MARPAAGLRRSLLSVERGLGVGILVLLAGCDAACHRTDEAASTVSPRNLEEAAWSLDVTGEPSVLELESGSVAVTMPGERAVFIFDSTGRALDTLGREGEGPGEFQMASSLFRGLQGAFAVLDPVARRLTYYGADLRYDSIREIPVVHDARSVVRVANGSWLSLAGSAVGRRDSARIRVSDAKGLEHKSIASLHTPLRRMVPFGAIAINTPPEYAARDAWGVTSAGEVWIARGGDFRIDWILHGGSFVEGEPQPFQAIRTVKDDLGRWRGLPAPEYMSGVDRPMASIKAPFQSALGTDAGDVWFWLNQRSGFTTERFECRQRDGMPGTTLLLPKASKLVHIGRRRLYVYAQTEAGDAKLSAHATVPCAD